MRQGEVIRTEDTDGNNYQNKGKTQLNEEHKGDRNTKTKVKNRRTQRGIY